MTLSKARRSWGWHCGAASRGSWGWFSPTACGTAGTGDTCNHAEGAGGLGWAAQACKEAMLPFLKDTWVFPSPDYPTSPPTVPIHSLCFCPGVCFLGPFSLEMMQNASSDRANLQPPTLAVFPVWLVALFWRSAYLWGSFGLWEVEMDLSLSLVDYFPQFPSCPRAAVAADSSTAWVGCLEEEWGNHCEHRKLPVALVSATILDIIRKAISFSNFQDRGDGSWLIIGSCCKKTCIGSS